MQVIRDLSVVPASAQGAVIALGNFDGLHRGHLAVLGEAKKMAEELHAPLGMMSFEPHPRRFFNPSLPTLRLMPLGQKLQMLREIGVDTFYLMRFDKAFSQLTAQRFIDDILVQKLAVKGVVTGQNFIFGYQRSGDAEFLTQKAEEKGFRYTPLASQMLGSAACSSTRIREAIALGDMEQAARLLGRPYAMTGRIVKGDQRGRELGFPTANLRPGELFMPAYGIYVVQMRVDGRCYPGVANFGIRPMYTLPRPLLETYLFDQKLDLYGKKVSVEFLHYLRGEEYFASEEALIAQMNQDEQNARQWLKSSIESKA